MAYPKGQFSGTGKAEVITGDTSGRNYERSMKQRSAAYEQPGHGKDGLDIMEHKGNPAPDSGSFSTAKRSAWMGSEQAAYYNTKFDEFYNIIPENGYGDNGYDYGAEAGSSPHYDCYHYAHGSENGDDAIPDASVQGSGIPKGKL